MKFRCQQMGYTDSYIIGPDDRILVTGAAGFIGVRVLADLLNRGFRNFACFARPTSDLAAIEAIVKRHPRPVKVDIVRGDLLSNVDCEVACKGAAVVFHLAVGTRQKSFPDA